VILVVYAILAEQNIAKLFLAAMVPGILAAIGYMITIAIYVRVNPDAAGVRPPVPMAERFRALIDVLPVLIVFLVVVGGIYLGVFTPTEGAAVGAAGTGIIALLNGGLRGRAWADSFYATARSTAMIFFIVLGAAFYNGFLALTQVPQELAGWVVEQGFNPWLVLVMILVLYLIFGCLMDSLSMILLTIPIFFPIVSALDFGMGPEEFAIWFGIIVLIVVEVGLITPPVGMNLFVINSMDKETPIVKTYGAVMYFVGSDIVRVALLVMFPGISLFLLRMLY
jgi:tripartite ATP-independent transporter DctM subunit